MGVAYRLKKSKFYISKENKELAFDILKSTFTSFEIYKKAGVDDDETFYKQFRDSQTFENAAQLAGWFGVNDVLSDSKGNAKGFKKGGDMDSDPTDSIIGFYTPIAHLVKEGSFIEIGHEGREISTFSFSGGKIAVSIR
ncbi:MAG: hypothetical protein COA99_19585 [Moraxellaceae bacterium]|nr:MAG: hypothetical protein COA99_19585 [Moraxellaceae bacterium]